MNDIKMTDHDFDLLIMNAVRRFITVWHYVFGLSVHPSEMIISVISPERVVE